MVLENEHEILGVKMSGFNINIEGDSKNNKIVRNGMTVGEYIKQIELEFKNWAESTKPDTATYEGAFEFKEHLVKMAGVSSE